MKWVNHQVVTGVIVYTATEDLLLTAYSMAGAILPDKVEGNPRAGSYWSWRSRHRGWSHWPMLYLGLIFFLSRLEEGQLTALPTAEKDFEWFLGRPGKKTRRGPAATDSTSSSRRADKAPIWCRARWPSACWASTSRT